MGGSEFDRETGEKGGQGATVEEVSRRFETRGSLIGDQDAGIQGFTCLAFKARIHAAEDFRDRAVL